MTSEDEDEKIPCKYGSNCYQQNSEHHRRFKHPKRKSKEDSNDRNKNHTNQGPFKKFKVEDTLNMVHDQNVSQREGIDKHDNSIVKLEETNEKAKIEEYKDSPKLIKPEDKFENTGKKLVSDDESSLCVKSNASLLSNIKLKIESICLVNMPSDFFSFFQFCESLDKNRPKQALAAVGLYLVGPFDLIDMDTPTVDQSAVLRHYRYYYDPPEFQTLLRCDDKNLLHYGYYRDIPEEEPVFVASNEAMVGCSLNIISDNLFSAVNIHIDKIKKTADPFKKIKIQKIQNSLVDWSKTNDFTLASLTRKMRERRAKVVAKTFHGAGIVVPFNKKTELGYRELKEDNNTLKKMLKKIVEAETEEDRKVFWGKLQPVITYASIANDECDFGTGLELGLDLFCFGHEILHKAVTQILTTSYNLLGRNKFAMILESHLIDRKKGGDVFTIYQ